MSKIEDLIMKLCPNGVPYIELKEMAEIGTGKSDRKDAVDTGEYPFYVRSKDILRINKFEYDEKAIIIPGEGGIGEIFHYVEGKYALHQRAYRIHVIDKKLNTKYLYYYMFAYFKKFIMKKAVTATVTSIRKPMIELFPIAVPPMEVQNEIVHILDDFTLLSAELSAELKARQEQFDFYLNKLFENIEIFKELEEISEIRGRIGFRGYTRQDMVKEGEGAISLTASNITKRNKIEYKDNTYITWSKYEESPEIMVQNGDIIICQRGSIGKTALIENLPEKATINPQLLLIKNITCNNKYLAYYFRTLMFKKSLNKITGHGTVQMIAQKDVRKIKIPIPDMKEQERIVKILDRLDLISHSIVEGLPAEIEARQRQYEYYRDKLLTFKELVNEE